MKRILLLSFVLLGLITSAWAQRTVSGNVSDAVSGDGLPGVAVRVKNTSLGSVTDMDGNYRLEVPAGSNTLVFSFVGYADREVAIGNQTTINVQLSEDVEQLSEVVVTAIGIERDQKALGYAVAKVGSEQLEQQSEGDVGRLLKGKASGVNVVQTSGVSGSGTNIIIRGYSSVTQSNQPLFVVDGVPFDAGTNQQNNFVDGQTESSRFLDLDPNNIESINVLKGLSATTLYGERGRNGVILVTTKNGSGSNINKKAEITLTSSYFANEIASLPDYQNSYGAGFYQAAGQFFSNWGASFEDVTEVAHPYGSFADDQTQAAFEEYIGQRYAYKPYDNVKGFFRTGGVLNTSLNIRGGGEKVNYNVSYGFMNDEGFTPGNELTRNNFGFGGNAELANNFKVGASFNYTATDYVTPPIAASLGSGTVGGGSSIFGDVFYTPRSVDLMGLPYQNPVTGGPVYYRAGNDIQNPRWTAENAGAQQDVGRFFGNTYLQYNFTDWLNLNYRVGLDTYTESNMYFQNKNGVDGPVTGLLRNSTVRNTIWDHNLLLSANRDLTENFTLSSNIGVNARRDEYDRTGIEHTNQVVFGVLRDFNFTAHSNERSFSGAPLQYSQDQNWLGVYASASLDYRNYLFLTLQGRNDWVNTLESGNNSLFYPSASLALDATSAIPALQQSNLINYLKLRAGYGSSAGFPRPYNTRSTLALSGRAFINEAGNPVITNTVSNVMGNPNLQPERSNELELGIESNWLNNRFSLNFSVFQRNTIDLLLDRELDPSTGFTSQLVNAGELRVRGVEVDYGITPIKGNEFQWKIGGVFTADRSTIIDLPEGVDQIVIAGFTNLGNFAIEGEPYGAMMGSRVLRDDQGRMVVDATGNYVQNSELEIIGNPQADFQTSLTNTFTYKGIKLGFEWQYRQGGDIYSLTAASLLGRGLTTDTDFNREQTYVLPGVTAEGAENNMQIAATDLYFNNFGFGPDEFRVFDGTTIRLNEVTLGYSLPKGLLERTPFGNIEISAAGYNLWYKAVNFPEGVNFDTNVLGTGVGNGLGFDFLNGPSSRRYGASVKLTF